MKDVRHLKKKDQAKKLKDAKDKKDKDKDLEKGEDTPKTPRATLTGDEELTYIPGPVPAAPSP